MFGSMLIILGFTTAYGTEITSEYRYSCIHYCQTYTYNGYQTYCCRIAQISFQKEEEYDFNTLSETETSLDSETGTGFLHLDDYTDSHETETISISNAPSEDDLYIPGIYSPAGAGQQDSPLPAPEINMNPSTSEDYSPFGFGSFQESLLPFAYPDDLVLPKLKTETMTCPPVRRYCPNYAPRAFPMACDSHEECAETDLCCPDKCLKQVVGIDNVCKTGNPILNY